MNVRKELAGIYTAKQCTDLRDVEHALENAINLLYRAETENKNTTAIAQRMALLKERKIQLENSPMSKVEQIDLDKVRTKNYYDTIDRLGEHTDTCLICGQRTNGKQKMVHLLTNGNLVASDQEQDFDNSQGFFYVGNNCAKKIGSQFSFKINF